MENIIGNLEETLRDVKTNLRNSEILRKEQAKQIEKLEGLLKTHKGISDGKSIIIKELEKPTFKTVQTNIRK